MFTESKAAFLGSGWAFPPAFSSGGEDVLFVQNEQDIIESIKILLSTSLGERVMQEDYGCNLQDYLFEELDNRLLANIRTEITKAIRLHETRIDLEDVGFDIQADYKESVIYIRLTFRVRTTNSRYNMVYPFYLNESIAANGLYQSNTHNRTNRAIEPQSVEMEIPDPEVVDLDAATKAMSHGEFEAFQHTATAANTNNWTQPYTILNNSKLNGDPNAMIFISSIWQTANSRGTGIANPNGLEVGYVADKKQWAIFNRSKALMDKDYAFNVLIAPKPITGIDKVYSNAFIHKASPQSRLDSYALVRTFIDNPLTNEKPDIHLLVTPRKSILNNIEIGVFYLKSLKKWVIYNSVDVSRHQDNPLPFDTEFNVLVLPAKQFANLEVLEPAQQIRIDDTTHRIGTYFTHTGLVNNPKAMLFMTQEWILESDRGGINEYPTQLRYNNPPNDAANLPDKSWYLIHPVPNTEMGTGVYYNTVWVK